MTLAENRKRARSEVEKEARKQAILTAAHEMVSESGFEGVTMSGLARRAGLAKGTLYLYVRSKEELFLALFVAAMKELVDRFETQARAKTLAEDITRLAIEVPLFLPLYARLVAVIEVAVADTPLFEAKRAIAALSARFIARLAALSGAEPDKAAQVGSALMLAMQGAAQFDITAQRPLDDVPEDLRPMFADHGFEAAFLPAAKLILGTLAQR